MATDNKNLNALEAYKVVLALKPYMVRTRVNMGIAYFNMENYEEAIKHLLTA